MEHGGWTSPNNYQVLPEQYSFSYRYYEEDKLIMYSTCDTPVQVLYNTVVDTVERAKVRVFFADKVTIIQALLPSYTSQYHADSS